MAATFAGTKFQLGTSSASFGQGHNYNVKVKALLEAVTKPAIQGFASSFKSAKWMIGGRPMLWSDDVTNLRTNAMTLFKHVLSSLNR